MLSPIHSRKLSKQLRTVQLIDAAAEPVSIADYQLYERQGNMSIPQSVFNGKIRSARHQVENYLGRCLVSQTYAAVMDLPPGMMSSIGSVLARFEGYIPTAIELRWVPLRQVSSIYVTDDSGTQNVCPPSTYWVGQQRISLLDTQVWPDTLGRAFETFTVQYTTGYAIPFTAAGALLTTKQPHGLVNGAVRRAWTTSDGALPAGLSADTDYFVVDATSFTFGLSETLNGSAIATSDGGTGVAFLGAIPDHFLRAILALAAMDLFPDRKKTGRLEPVGRSGLPTRIEEMLGMDRWGNS